jgi:3-hydroxybutyryl-CoA dehydrogenase
MASMELIGVAGGGLMGCGIAAKLAAVGQRVAVYERLPSAAAQVQAHCAAVFDELVHGGALSAAQAAGAAALVAVTEDSAGLAGAGLVIEAVSESLPTKHALYAELEGQLADDAIIASSTSGFTPARLCAGMRRPERFLVAHFWNPPHLVPLVEVVAGPATRAEVLDRVMRLLAELDCSPVLLRKAVPGFIGNRLQFAVLREALHLLEAGVADAETIDLVMKQSIGRRYAAIGPLEGADIGGLSTFTSIAGYLWRDLAHGEEGLATLRGFLDDGAAGRRSGRGFYVWDEAREAWLRRVRLELLQRQSLARSRERVQDRPHDRTQDGQAQFNGSAAH